MNDIAREAARRRTFAIISHPDAGKTTLTEKFLLYGGALHLAGSVSARKNGIRGLCEQVDLLFCHPADFRFDFIGSQAMGAQFFLDDLVFKGEFDFVDVLEFEIRACLML
jgi:hypothetical protein